MKITGPWNTPGVQGPPSVRPRSAQALDSPTGPTPEACLQRSAAAPRTAPGSSSGKGVKDLEILHLKAQLDTLAKRLFPERSARNAGRILLESVHRKGEAIEATLLVEDGAVTCRASIEVSVDGCTA